MDNEVFKIYKETRNTRWGHRVYEVSNLGRVKCNGKIVEPYMNGKYLKISTFGIHRAVAELFVPNPENKPCVDHINTDRLDNRAENLRWVTTKENSNNPLTRKHKSASMKGRHLSKEHKEKIANSVRCTFSEERKQKISAAHKGKILTEEHKAKLSAALQGRHWKLVDGKRTYYKK